MHVSEDDYENYAYSLKYNFVEKIVSFQNLVVIGIYALLHWQLFFKFSIQVINITK
jgi:hypothetical protein